MLEPVAHSSQPNRVSLFGELIGPNLVFVDSIQPALHVLGVKICVKILKSSRQLFWSRFNQKLMESWIFLEFDAVIVLYALDPSDLSPDLLLLFVFPNLSLYCAALVNQKSSNKKKGESTLLNTVNHYYFKSNAC